METNHKQGKKYFLIGTMLTIAGVLFGLHLYTQWHVEQTHIKYAPQGQFMEVRGVKLHYLRQGLGQPVVFIHGSFSTSAHFQWSLFDTPHLPFDAIAFDLPGYGYSERPKHKMTLYDHAEYLHKALDQLGIDRPVIVGHSYGGAVAMAYALRYSRDISSLVLLAGYITPFTGPVHPMYSLPSVPIVGDIFVSSIMMPLGKAVSQDRLTNSFFPTPVPQEYAEMATSFAIRPTSYRGNAEDIRELPGMLRRMQPLYSKIRKPVYIVTGDQDRVSKKEIHAEDLHHRVENSQLFILPDRGHMLPFESREKVIDIIKLALEERRSSQRSQV